MPVAPLRPEDYPLCPECGTREHVHHSGWLFQEAPDAPRLDPEVELLRCFAPGCHTFRADGMPFDEKAAYEAWRGLGNPRHPQLEIDLPSQAAQPRTTGDHS